MGALEDFKRFGRDPSRCLSSVEEDVRALRAAAARDGDMARVAALDKALAARRHLDPASALYFFSATLAALQGQSRAEWERLVEEATLAGIRAGIADLHRRGFLPWRPGCGGTD